MLETIVAILVCVATLALIGFAITLFLAWMHKQASDGGFKDRVAHDAESIIKKATVAKLEVISKSLADRESIKKKSDKELEDEINK